MKKAMDKAVLVRAVLGFMFLSMILFSSCAVMVLAVAADGARKQLQAVQVLSEVNKRQYFDLLDRVVEAEETANDALCKLSTLEEEYTGCGAGPVDEDDEPETGYDEEDTEEAITIDSDTMGVVLSDFWQMVKASGGEFDEQAAAAMSADGGK